MALPNLFSSVADRITRLSLEEIAHTLNGRLQRTNLIALTESSQTVTNLAAGASVTLTFTHNLRKIPLFNVVFAVTGGTADAHSWRTSVSNTTEIQVVVTNHPGGTTFSATITIQYL